MNFDEFSHRFAEFSYLCFQSNTGCLPAVRSSFGVPAPDRRELARVINLMDALRRSVEAKRKPAFDHPQKWRRVAPKLNSRGRKGRAERAWSPRWYGVLVSPFWQVQSVGDKP